MHETGFDRINKKHPWPASQKKPTLIRKENTVTWVLPIDNPYFSDFNRVYVSTNKLHAGIAVIGPGGRLEPPNRQAGDEVACVLKGTLTMSNPETGATYEARAGEALYIPEGTYHHIFNFTNESMIALWFAAPDIWKAGTNRAFTGTPKTFKAKSPSKK